MPDADMPCSADRRRNVFIFDLDVAEKILLPFSDEKMPTPTVAVFVASFLSVASVASFVALSVLPQDVWQLWDARNSSYCEPPQTGSVQEPINAWSNVAYIIIGARTVSARHTLDRDVAFFTLIGLTLLLLGQASFLFHASFARTWRRTDSALTRAMPIALLGFSCARLVREWRVVFALTLFAQSLCFDWKSTTVFLATLVPLAMIELVGLPLLGRTSWRRWRWSGLSLFAFLASWLVRELEVRRVLCLFSTWFQPHSLWHVGTAFAVYTQLRAWDVPPQMGVT